MAKQKNLTANDTWFFGHPKGMVTLFFGKCGENVILWHESTSCSI